jgi:hypothetical protein
MSDITKEEIHDKAKQMLSSIGVDNPTVGQTTTIPTQETAGFEVIDIEINETTRPGQKALNQFPRRGDERVVNNLYKRPLCNILGCGILSAFPGNCKKVSEEYIDPTIDFENTPRKIKNATVNIDFNPRITGDVEIGADNFSKPGEVITTTEYKCSENEEDTEIVDDSAILDMNAEHTIIDEAVNETIDTVQSTIPNIGPELSKSTDVDFVREGSINTLKGIVQNWRTGRIRGQVNGSVNIQYEWKGSTKNRTFDVTTTSMLPVEGDLSVDWPLV